METCISAPRAGIAILGFISETIFVSGICPPF
jgi:hypothetical protein